MKSEKVQLRKQTVQKLASISAKKAEDKFPVNSPESQGDRADQAESQIEADLQEEIEQARHPKDRR